MIIRNQFHMAFYAAALAISITVLMFTVLQRRTDRPQNRRFIGMLIIVMLNAASATGSAIIEPFVGKDPLYYYLLLFFQNSYFIIHTALCPALYSYVVSVTGTARRRNMLNRFVFAIPFMLTEILTLVNPMFGIVFYYDGNMVFHRNWAEYIIYGVAALYFLLSVMELMFTWNALTLRRSIALSYFFVIALLGVAIQLVKIDIKSELFAEALAMMGAMLAVESEDDRLDADTNIYNRRAMQMDFHNIFTMRESVSVIFIKVINTHIIERVTRTSNDDAFAIACSDFLKTLLPRYQIYHPNTETFVLLCSRMDETKVEHIANSIRDRFSKEWDIFGASFLLEAVVIKADLPKDISSIDDAFYVADSILPPGVEKNKAELDWLMRRAEIERAIRRSIKNHSFEVYYQPTYDVGRKCLHGAEALVRMKDSTMGYVSPEEFIPIAEQIGLVEQIDDFVLREVCMFLKSGVPASHGMECINVNLSVIQCMRPGFFEHLISIVDSFDLNHELLNFEITESVGAEDYAALSNVAHRIKEAGFYLSMDDYGTGYSNMDGIFSLDFDVVKVDKSILWNAQKDHRGRVILENSISMIHDLGCKILVEGVETKEQLEMLQTKEVDYLQGYYFSKPVPRDEFLRLIDGIA